MWEPRRKLGFAMMAGMRIASKLRQSPGMLRASSELVNEVGSGM